MCRLISVLFISFCTSVFIACGSDSDTERSASTKPIVGTWVTSCIVVASSDGSEGDVKYTFEFKSDSTWEKLQTNYSTGDGSCDTAGNIYKSGGKYLLGKEVEGLEETKEIDLSYTVQALTPVADKDTKFFNENKACGKGDWQTDKEVSILGEGCTTFGITGIPSGAKQYLIYQVKDKTLTMGDDKSGKNGGTEELRPETLGTSERFIFTKLSD